MCRVLHRLDNLLKSLATEAVKVTQVVCSAQNEIRKKFVSDLKRSMSDVLQVKKDWQQLIVQLTHERLVSFSFLYYHSDSHLFSCQSFLSHDTLCIATVSHPSVRPSVHDMLMYHGHISWVSS